MNDQTPPAVAPAGAAPLRDTMPAPLQVPAEELEQEQSPTIPEVAAARLSAEIAARHGGPMLVHSGTYALWQTPAGYYHLTYRRTASTDPDTGAVTAVDNSPDVHLRDLPPHAAEMVISVLDRGTELPPMLQQFFFGGNPLAGGKLAAMKQIGALMKEGGLESLMQFAQNGAPDGPVE